MITPEGWTRHTDNTFSVQVPSDLTAIPYPQYEDSESGVSTPVPSAPAVSYHEKLETREELVRGNRK